MDVLSINHPDVAPASAELKTLEGKRLGSYIGFNLTRHYFADKADAERYLVLKMKLGLCGPYLLYGGEVDPHVEAATDNRWAAVHD